MIEITTFRSNFSGRPLIAHKRPQRVASGRPTASRFWTIPAFTKAGRETDVAKVGRGWKAELARLYF
jgi:hypothetical protein